MLKITKAEFIKSAADQKGFLPADRPVIAVAGKSNVGKSTFINMLSGVIWLRWFQTGPDQPNMVK